MDQRLFLQFRNILNFFVDGAPIEKIGRLKDSELVNALGDDSDNEDDEIGEAFGGEATGETTTPAEHQQTEAARQYEKVIPFPGAFHFFMEAFKLCNRLNEEMVTFLVKQYIGKGDAAATPKNVDYFINFSDPIQYE